MQCAASTSALGGSAGDSSVPAGRRAPPGPWRRHRYAWRSAASALSSRWPTGTSDWEGEQTSSQNPAAAWRKLAAPPSSREPSAAAPLLAPPTRGAGSCGASTPWRRARLTASSTTSSPTAPHLETIVCGVAPPDVIAHDTSASTIPAAPPSKANFTSCSAAWSAVSGTPTSSAILVMSPPSRAPPTTPRAAVFGNPPSACRRSYAARTATSPASSMRDALRSTVRSNSPQHIAPTALA
mmetsp:Transcript_66550/g.210630  ORF Transcript_66550/g.210630 Transcript_66550/m.210630 type:complete len:239 (+) Transcript_66550:602-1318(+)